jgi:uncharacterized protein YqfA (UPF0365 family)
LRLVPLLVVLVLELLELLLLTGAAFVAGWTYVGLWAGLLAAGVTVGVGGWLMERRFTGRSDPKH